MGAPLFLLSAAALYFLSRGESEAAQPAQDQRTGNQQGGSMGQQTIYNGARLTPRQRAAAAVIVDAARAIGINPAYMLALAVTESSLDPSAIGDDGKSTGLFQLLVSTARLNDATATADDLLDPAENARLACLEARRVIRAYPGYTWGDQAEAWTLGPRGRFVLGKRNPGKLVRMERAARDLDLTLDLNERAVTA